MEKRSSSKGRSEWVEDVEAISEFRDILEDDEPKSVQLMLLRPVNLIIVGPATGKTYYFNGAGSVAAVDELDAPQLLEKRAAGSCCGNERPTYFQVV